VLTIFRLRGNRPRHIASCHPHCAYNERQENKLFHRFVRFYQGAPSFGISLFEPIGLRIGDRRPSGSLSCLSERRCKSTAFFSTDQIYAFVKSIMMEKASNRIPRSLTDPPLPCGTASRGLRRLCGICGRSGGSSSNRTAGFSSLPYRRFRPARGSSSGLTEF